MERKNTEGTIQNLDKTRTGIKVRSAAGNKLLDGI